MEVTIQEAQAALSGLIARAQVGEEIVIASDGKPVARLVAASRKGQARKPGSAKGDFVVPDDFNTPLPGEVLKAFGV